MNKPNSELKSPARPDRTLVLVGHMGAGKTTIGRRLATRLGLHFIDADAEIETAAGCTIADFFEFHGEKAFREGERRVIARLLEQPAHVLATGGGAFVDPETRELIRHKAVSIWLRAEVATLVKRVKRRGHRPLLKDGDPEQIMGRLIQERSSAYAEADITVDSADGPHADVVEAIIGELGNYYHNGDQTP
ncbi:MAG: shikimate kinase [Sphingomonadales bacterium]